MTPVQVIVSGIAVMVVNVLLTLYIVRQRRATERFVQEALHHAKHYAEQAEEYFHLTKATVEDRRELPY